MKALLLFIIVFLLLIHEVKNGDIDAGFSCVLILFALVATIVDIVREMIYKPLK